MHDFTIVNLDTDSISFCKKDQSPFSKEETEALLTELNSRFPDGIKWADDGLYETMVVLKAKNYILYDGKKIKQKGSALKSSKIEPALKEMIAAIIDKLVNFKQDEIIDVYKKYIKETLNVKDISRWASKKTVTEKVLTSERTNEVKIKNALEGTHYQMGDKVYMYFKTDESLGTVQNWNNDHDSMVLVEKVYKTLSLFKNVIKLEDYTKYHLKRNREKLNEINNS